MMSMNWIGACYLGQLFFKVYMNDSREDKRISTVQAVRDELIEIRFMYI